MDQALSLHLDWCRARNLRPMTVEQRRATLLRLAKTLPRPLSRATEADLTGWWADLCGRYTPGARATALSHVQCFYRWQVRQGYRVDDPSVRLDRPRLPRLLPRPIGDGNLQMALDLAPPRESLILHLAAYAGLRACEIARLRREHVRDDTDPPVLFVADGKGGRQRIVPIHPRLWAVMRPQLPRRGWVLARLDGRPGQQTAHRTSQMANRYLHSLGIPDTLHQCRHRFATELYRASKDLRLTQETLGHASPTTTAAYVKWADDRSAEAVLKVP